jgi:hypothetical protein
MTENTSLTHKLDISKIKTFADVQNIFKCMHLVSSATEDHPDYELLKEYFTFPYETPELKFQEPPKSIEELKEEFENTLTELLVKTKRKFAVSKKSAEYRFKIKSDNANSRFEYAKKNGEFLQYLSLTTSSNVTIGDSNVPNSYLSMSNSALSWGTEFNLNPSKNSVGYYFVEPDVKFNMTKRPNRIVQFFMRNLLGFKWVDN